VVKLCKKKMVMRSQGWQLNELAERVRVSKSTVSKWFTRGTMLPKNLRRVAAVLGRDVRYFTEEDYEDQGPAEILRRQILEEVMRHCEAARGDVEVLRVLLARLQAQPDAGMEAMIEMMRAAGIKGPAARRER